WVVSEVMIVSVGTARPARTTRSRLPRRTGRIHLPGIHRLLRLRHRSGRETAGGDLGRRELPTFARCAGGDSAPMTTTPRHRRTGQNRVLRLLERLERAPWADPAIGTLRSAVRSLPL